MHNIEARTQLVLMSQQAFREGLFAGTSGNLSTFDPETGFMTITPSTVPYETMTADDAICMKLDGEILFGTHRPSSEWRMHACVYQNRPDVLAVVHTHSPYATSFAVRHEVIPVILIEMVPFLGGAVPVAKFALPGTIEVGTEAVEAMKESGSCLMSNHGVLTIGTSLAQAHTRAVYVEDAAKIYSLAKMGGSEGVHLIPDEYVQAMRDRMKNKGGAKK